MKTTAVNSLTKNLSIWVLATVIIFSFQSCATKAIFLTSSVVPAAQGEVTIKKNKNNNFAIKIDISDLAEIDRLEPPKKGYVVWMESDRGFTSNIGQITSSNRLNASFETSATLRPTKIFITAEDDIGVQYPGSMVVLTTDRIYE